MRPFHRIFNSFPAHRDSNVSSWSLGSVLVLASLLWTVGALMPKHAFAVPDSDTSAAIEYLIGSVSRSDMVFVRNFSEHDAQRAAKHIRDKYEHFVDDIDSPEKFIELCASESLMTGRDYRVVLPNGEEHLARDWMLNLLTEYRSQPRSGGTQ